MERARGGGHYGSRKPRSKEARRKVQNCSTRASFHGGVERTRRTRHFFERKLQALLRGLFFTYFGFLFLFVTSSRKIFNNRYIVLRVIVCYYRKKSERSIVFNERHEKRIVERKRGRNPRKNTKSRK